MFGAAVSASLGRSGIAVLRVFLRCILEADPRNINCPIAQTATVLPVVPRLQYTRVDKMSVQDLVS
jgi:hypothetical protein